MSADPPLQPPISAEIVRQARVSRAELEAVAQDEWHAAVLRHMAQRVTRETILRALTLRTDDRSECLIDLGIHYPTQFAATLLPIRVELHRYVRRFINLDQFRCELLSKGCRGRLWFVVRPVAPPVVPVPELAPLQPVMENTIPPKQQTSLIWLAPFCSLITMCVLANLFRYLFGAH